MPRPWTWCFRCDRQNAATERVVSLLEQAIEEAEQFSLPVRDIRHTIARLKMYQREHDAPCSKCSGVKGQIIPWDELPRKAQLGRAKDLCNAKHPRAEFWCWLPAGHDGKDHTAGLEDWEK